MSSRLCGQRKVLWKCKAIVSAPMFAHIFVTLPRRCFRSSCSPIPTCWDGTDPLIGGHAGAPGGGSLLDVTAGGQRS